MFDDELGDVKVVDEDRGDVSVFDELGGVKVVVEDRGDVSVFDDEL